MYVRQLAVGWSYKQQSTSVEVVVVLLLVVKWSRDKILFIVTIEGKTFNGAPSFTILIEVEQAQEIKNVRNWLNEHESEYIQIDR